MAAFSWTLPRQGNFQARGMVAHSFYGCRLVQGAGIPIEKWIQVTKELQVSLFQTMILLLFNDPAKKSWTLEEIEAETRIGKPVPTISKKHGS